MKESIPVHYVSLLIVWVVDFIFFGVFQYCFVICCGGEIKFSQVCLCFIEAVGMFRFKGGPRI